MSNFIRPSAIAGHFYSANPVELAKGVEGFLKLDEEDAVTTISASQDSLPSDKPWPKILIAPHAGHVFSGALAGEAYQLWKPARGIIRKIVMLGPCHRVGIQGIAATSASHWQTPLGKVTIDEELRAKALSLKFVQSHDQAHEQEHCLEVHLPFLQSLFGDGFSYAPFAVGWCEIAQVSQLIEALWGGDETGIVISTDLSHFHNYGTAQALDNKTANDIENFAWTELSHDQACGRTPLSGLLNLGIKRDLTLARVGLCNSGDTAGDKQRVVGYGAWAVWPGREDGVAAGVTLVEDHPPVRAKDVMISRLASKEAQQKTEGKAMNDMDSDDQTLVARYGKELLRIARQAVEAAARQGQQLAVQGQLPAELSAKRAVFITIEKQGALRGCIGSLRAHRSLVDDVLANSYAAALKDHRFPPLTAEELPQIGVSISLLETPQPMQFRDEADFMAQVRPMIDGLIIADQGKSATYLPSVWEQITDKAQFLASLKQKAGLPPNHWSDSFQAWRYGATKIA